MIKQPKISIIVPVYNTANYLDCCLDSLRRQTYTNLEIILINDGSTDSSGKKCDEYAILDERIRVKHKINEGVSKARNMGLDMATGDYISCIDSDDYLELNCYQLVVDTILQESCDILVFDYYNNYPNNEILHRTHQTYLKELSHSTFLQSILYSVNPFAWTKVISKQCCQTIRFSESIHWGEDSMFVHEVAKNAKKIYSIDAHLLHYVQSENSATRSTYFNSKLLSGLEMADYFIKETQQLCPNHLHAAYAKKVNMLASLKYESLKLPRRDEQRKLISKLCLQLFCKLLVFSRISMRCRVKLFLITLLPFLYKKIHLH